MRNVPFLAFTFACCCLCAAGAALGGYIPALVVGAFWGMVIAACQCDA